MHEVPQNLNDIVSQWLLVIIYSWFHIKGTWSVHSFNGNYLTIPSAHSQTDLAVTHATLTQLTIPGNWG